MNNPLAQFEQGLITEEILESVEPQDLIQELVEAREFWENLKEQFTDKYNDDYTPEEQELQSDENQAYIIALTSAQSHNPLKTPMPRAQESLSI